MGRMVGIFWSRGELGNDKADGPTYLSEGGMLGDSEELECARSGWKSVGGIRACSS